jgi:uncharacterized protein YecT (DUF1311 family)
MTESEDREPLREAEVAPDREHNPWQLDAVGLAVLALILLAVLLFSRGRGDENQDRLSDVVVEDGESTTPEQQCASRSVHERIKRELFRRAAQVRGSDADAFASVAGHASVRMEAPMATRGDEDAAVVSCTGLLWLDLPPGVVAEGGRRTLSGDIIYTVRRSSGGDPMLAGLGNADAIVAALAALVRTRAPEDEALNEMAPATDGAVIAPQDGFDPAVPPSDAPAGASAGPSFDCAAAGTPSEIAVCNDASLAALDRQMAALYNRSLSTADARQRALLVQTRDRFLAYREGCRTNSCIAGAYQGRMREISDIMGGRWQPPR